MSNETEETLAEWINREVETRGWTLRELARRSNLIAPTISKISRGERTYIEKRTWEGLARALGITVDEVMARAGILPDRGDVLPEVQRWSDWLREFSLADRQRLTAMVEQIFQLALAARQNQAYRAAELEPDPVEVAEVD